MTDATDRSKRDRVGNGWIGVDLDGTLAHYDGWKGEEHIGPPIPAMAQRVKGWLAVGIDVRIFTARASNGEKAIGHVEDWAELHLGARLVVTNVKDYGLVELWDDRAVRVVFNEGERCCEIDPS